MTNTKDMGAIMKNWLAIALIALIIPVAAQAEEKKSFWAKLVPDNSSALDFLDNTKTFAGNLFEDTKETGKALLNGGMGIIENTGETIKSLTSDE